MYSSFKREFVLCNYYVFVIIYSQLFTRNQHTHTHTHFHLPTPNAFSPPHHHTPTLPHSHISHTTTPPTPKLSSISKTSWTLPCKSYRRPCLNACSPDIPTLSHHNITTPHPTHRNTTPHTQHPHPTYTYSPHKIIQSHE